MSIARTFAFGSFTLTPERQMLLREGTAMRIGGRALDLLTALVERPGELVTKCELMARGWPTTTVDECNLKVNMALLRRVLSDDPRAAQYIATVTGRGYRFIAPVEAKLPADPRAAPVKGPKPSPVIWQPSMQGDQPATSIRLVDLPPAAENVAASFSWINDLLETVDYGIVVEGEITILLNETTVLLRPGSLIVQPSTGQGWANRSDKLCRMLFVRYPDCHALNACASSADTASDHAPPMTRKY